MVQRKKLYRKCIKICFFKQITVRTDSPWRDHPKLRRGKLVSSPSCSARSCPGAQRARAFLRPYLLQDLYPALTRHLTSVGALLLPEWRKEKWAGGAQSAAQNRTVGAHPNIPSQRRTPPAPVGTLWCSLGAGTPPAEVSACVRRETRTLPETCVAVRWGGWWNFSFNESFCALGTSGFVAVESSRISPGSSAAYFFYFSIFKTDFWN